MPIYFIRTPVREPFIFDSIGNHWEQEHVIRPNGYPHYHYLQTESGEGTVRIQGRAIRLGVDEGILIAPFVKHSYMRTDETWNTLFATVTGSLEGSIDRILDGRKIILTEKGQGMRIRRKIEETMERYAAQPMDERALSVSCYEFLMNFADGVSGDETCNDPVYQRYIAPVLQEIETRYGERLTVAELSAGVYVTQQYLTRLFRRFLGCSVYEYITSLRISKAKELLSNRRLEIQAIAHQVGFEDASHFKAMFRKMTGMTPGEFRVISEMSEREKGTKRI